MYLDENKEVHYSNTVSLYFGVTIAVAAGETLVQYDPRRTSSQSPPRNGRGAPRAGGRRGIFEEVLTAASVDYLHWGEIFPGFEL